HAHRDVTQGLDVIFHGLHREFTLELQARIKAGQMALVDPPVFYDRAGLDDGQRKRLGFYLEAPHSHDLPVEAGVLLHLADRAVWFDGSRGDVADGAAAGIY